MAIDTANKRRSVSGYTGLFYAPTPDGALDAQDRAQLAWLYARAGGPPPPVVPTERGGGRERLRWPSGLAYAAHGSLVVVSIDPDGAGRKRGFGSGMAAARMAGVGTGRIRLSGGRVVVIEPDPFGRGVGDDWETILRLVTSRRWS